VVTNPFQAVAGGSWLGVLLANGSTIALAREDRIRGNPQWVSEALAEPIGAAPYGHTLLSGCSASRRKLRH